MAEQLNSDTNSEMGTATPATVDSVQNVGKVTLLEALAVDTDTSNVGPSMSNHTSEKPDYDDQ